MSTGQELEFGVVTKHYSYFNLQSGKAYKYRNHKQATNFSHRSVIEIRMIFVQLLLSQEFNTHYYCMDCCKNFLQNRSPIFQRKNIGSQEGDVSKYVTQEACRS
jgi:hypothetical protein